MLAATHLSSGSFSHNNPHLPFDFECSRHVASSGEEVLCFRDPVLPTYPARIIRLHREEILKFMAEAKAAEPAATR